jgi:hypothetical protein
MPIGRGGGPDSLAAVAPSEPAVAPAPEAAPTLSLADTLTDHPTVELAPPTLTDAWIISG